MKENCLADKFPSLASEWHPTKNGTLTPFNVAKKSGKKVWWICSKGHEWESVIANRANGNGCPGCWGRTAFGDNCLSTLIPKMAQEWHSTKNGKLTPFEVTVSSNKKVWWKCSKGHEWKAVVSSRTNGHGCPCCSGRIACSDNCLAILNSEIAREWHSTKNQLTSFDVTLGSDKKVWWKCSKGHEWEAIVGSRNAGNGCPFCSGKKTTKEKCLAILRPELAKKWHPTKNGKLTPFDVSLGSRKKVWWICSKGHEWKSRVNRASCPGCNGNKVYHDTCLGTLSPRLAQEWHVAKNEKLTPYDVTTGSNKKVWWKCLKGHEWEAVVNARYGCGQNCPYCTGKKVCEDNCLATLNPELAQEWHPTKNQLTPYDVTTGSNKKVWWKCPKKHEWEARVANRTNGNGCLRCKLSKTEQKCRFIFESIFQKPFLITRSILEQRLELDGYCHELTLAFEYNGRQHYEYVPFWHKTQDNFKKAQERDRRKARLCKEKGITLITIPYTENHQLEEFIQTQLSNSGIM